MPTSLNGVINNTSIKIGKTLNLYISADHAKARINVQGSVPPQIAIAWDVGGFSARPETWPAVAIKFNHVGQTGYWASGWINTDDNLPLAEGSTVSASNFTVANAGMTLPITITANSSGVVHDVSLWAYSRATPEWKAVKTWTDVTAGTALTITQAQAQIILNALTVVSDYVEYDVTTKLDGTVVASKTVQVMATVDNSEMVNFPSANVAEKNADVIALQLQGASPPASLTYFVAGKSNIWLRFPNGIQAGYGEYLKTLSVKNVANGANTELVNHTFPANYTGTTGLLEYPIPVSGSGGMILSIDLRGTRTAKLESRSITVLPYSTPKLTNLLVRRALSDGTLNEAGTNIRVDASTSYSPITVSSADKNTATLIMKYKRPAETTWSTPMQLALTNSPQSVSHTFPTDVSADQSFEVMVTIEDELDYAGAVQTLATQKVPFSIGKDEGVGVGKVWEAGALDILSYDSESEKGGIAIDGVLKSPWPWLSDQGGIADYTDFNDLEDGFYSHSGYANVENGPPVGGLVVVVTANTFRAQYVLGVGEICWRFQNMSGGGWLPWNYVADGTMDINQFISWLEQPELAQGRSFTLKINSLSNSHSNPPTLYMSANDNPYGNIYASYGSNSIGITQTGPFFACPERGYASKFFKDAMMMVSKPYSQTHVGQRGDVAYDEDYFYVCTATNYWKRIPWGTW